MGVIGDTLSAARTRRAVDLDEVHAATGIRPRYLQAIEQEDWDALPEEFYARSFIRKYARFLGVDPDPLVAEYKRQRGGGARGDAPTTPFARTTSRRADALRRRRKRQGIYAWLGAAVLAAAIVVAIVLISSGGGESGGTGEGKNAGGAAQAKGGAKGAAKGNGASGKGGGAAGKHAGAGTPKAKGVELEIEPTAEVWTCVVGGNGKPLVDGLTLAAGETKGPFHARSYTAAFGNGSVHILVDGKRAMTSPTPSPMGVSVNGKGKVHELPEGERPSCE
ncbi:MAG TPA: helix-turn-helix domain-containing protein [Solirubrobacterales bacterium]|nr:helix-turn-helix domain-containing protein [Solirubrobacterales bacterium]